MMGAGAAPGARGGAVAAVDRLPAPDRRFRFGSCRCVVVLGSTSIALLSSAYTGGPAPGPGCLRMADPSVMGAGPTARGGGGSIATAHGQGDAGHTAVMGASTSSGLTGGG